MQWRADDEAATSAGQKTIVAACWFTCHLGAVSRTPAYLSASLALAGRKEREGALVVGTRKYMGQIGPCNETK
jgi:hypothetical protein